MPGVPGTPDAVDDNEEMPQARDKRSMVCDGGGKEVESREAKGIESGA